MQWHSFTVLVNQMVMAGITENSEKSAGALPSSTLVPWNDVTSACVDRVPALLVVSKGRNFEHFYSFCGETHVAIAKGLACLVSQLRRPQVRLT